MWVVDGACSVGVYMTEEKLVWSCLVLVSPDLPAGTSWNRRRWGRPPSCMLGCLMRLEKREIGNLFPWLLVYLHCPPPCSITCPTHFTTSPTHFLLPSPTLVFYSQPRPVYPSLAPPLSLLFLLFAYCVTVFITGHCSFVIPFFLQWDHNGHCTASVWDAVATCQSSRCPGAQRFHPQHDYRGSTGQSSISPVFSCVSFCCVCVCVLQSCAEIRL